MQAKRSLSFGRRRLHASGIRLPRGLALVLAIPWTVSIGLASQLR
jgi:hypothetical protein